MNPFERKAVTFLLDSIASLAFGLMAYYLALALAWAGEDGGEGREEWAKNYLGNECVSHASGKDAV